MENKITFIKNNPNEQNTKVFIAEGVKIIGDVTLNENVGIWYNAVLRGDSGPITIGEGSNVQDNCVLHCDAGHSVNIGKNVTIGHGAIVHGCTIGDNCLIGMGSIILDDAKIGNNCIIGAGALVTGRTVIEEGQLVFGNPAKPVRALKEEEIAHIKENAQHYIQLAGLL